jgi:xylulokinase
MKYYIGVDVGTSSVKVMLIDGARALKTVSRDYPVYYPESGWSEQNPEDWLSQTLSAVSELTADIDKSAVEALSFSGQMHGLVTLDENDAVIRPAILWNDGRSEKQVDYLNNTLGKSFLLDSTGNIAFAGFTAPKVLWMYENEREKFDRISKIMLPKDYVAYMLTGSFATDTSDAAGTLYFDTEKRSWSREMLDVLHINENMLPKVYESDECIGFIKDEIAASLGFGKVKVIIGAGDNAASAIGTGTVEDGSCNISLGTSGTVFVTSDSYKCDRENAIHTFCSANRKYHYLACILSAASAQKWWLEDITSSAYEFEKAAEYAGKSDVMFLPYLMGERSPVNDTKVRGAFTGLSMNTSKDEMTLAVLEGVAFAFRQNIDIIRSLGVNITKSKVCGGGAKNRLWLSILANVLNITLQIPEFEHGGVLGAAMLAAKNCMSAEEYAETEKAFYPVIREIYPDETLVKYYDEKYRRYLKIYPAVKEIK